MVGKGIHVVIIWLVLVCLIAGQVRGDHGHLGLSEEEDELTLYFRKISGNRRLDPALGGQAISENVYHRLFIWADYYVDRPFVFSNFSLDLHLDVTIISSTASSMIKIAIQRNGDLIYSTDVFELPPGQEGDLQVDVLTEESIYPPITFNQGDEIGFFFQQIENLDPCRFLYNGTGGRDDSHMVIQLQGPDYPVVEVSPTDFDLSPQPGATVDTTLEITNVGYRHLHYSLSLPQWADTLYFDDGSPNLWWPLSDQYGHDFYNVRFTPAQNCTLKSALLLLSEEGSSGSPDLMVYVWDDSAGFPGAKLDSVLVPHSSLSFSPDWQVVDFAGKGLLIQGHRDFHIGYTCISHSPGDSLALFSDDGLPVGNQRRSSERWGENWKTMYERYDIDANFMIRALVNYGAPPDWVTLEATPGFLAPDSTDQIPLHLDATGLSNGIYRSGVVMANDSPDRSITVPIALRVGQTAVEGGEAEVTLPHSFLSVNYPNPFNAGTRIPYRIGSPDTGHEGQHVRLAIYNVLGQWVRKLVDELQPAGSYQVWWDGRDEEGVQVAAGIYLARLEVGGFRQVRKMVLLR